MLRVEQDMSAPNEFVQEIVKDKFEEWFQDRPFKKQEEKFIKKELESYLNELITKYIQDNKLVIQSNETLGNCKEFFKRRLSKVIREKTDTDPYDIPDPMVMATRSCKLPEQHQEKFKKKYESEINGFVTRVIPDKYGELGTKIINGSKLTYLEEMKKGMLLDYDQYIISHDRTVRAIRINEFGDRVYLLTENLKDPSDLVQLEACHIQSDKFQTFWKVKLQDVYEINPKGCSPPTFCLDDKEDHFHIVVQTSLSESQLDDNDAVDESPREYNSKDLDSKNFMRQEMRKEYEKEDENCKNHLTLVFYGSIKEMPSDMDTIQGHNITDLIQDEWDKQRVFVQNKFQNKPKQMSQELKKIDTISTMCPRWVLGDKLKVNKFDINQFYLALLYQDSYFVLLQKEHGGQQDQSNGEYVNETPMFSIVSFAQCRFDEIDERYITNIFSQKEKEDSDGNVVVALSRGIVIVNDIDDDEELSVQYQMLIEKDDILSKIRVYKVSEKTILMISRWGCGDKVGGAITSFSMNLNKEYDQMHTIPRKKSEMFHSIYYNRQEGQYIIDYHPRRGNTLQVYYNIDGISGKITPGVSYAVKPISEGLFQFSAISQNESTKVSVDCNGQYSDIIKVERRPVYETISRGITLFDSSCQNKIVGNHKEIHSFKQYRNISLALVGSQMYQVMEGRTSVRNGFYIQLRDMQNAIVIAYNILNPETETFAEVPEEEMISTVLDSSKDVYIIQLVLKKDEDEENLEFQVIDINKEKQRLTEKLGSMEVVTHPIEPEFTLKIENLRNPDKPDKDVRYNSDLTILDYNTDTKCVKVLIKNEVEIAIYEFSVVECSDENITCVDKFDIYNSLVYNKHMDEDQAYKYQRQTGNCIVNKNKTKILCKTNIKRSQKVTSIFDKKQSKGVRAIFNNDSILYDIETKKCRLLYDLISEKIKKNYKKFGSVKTSFKIQDACWSKYNPDLIYVRVITGEFEPFGNSIIQYYFGDDPVLQKKDKNNGFFRQIKDQHLVETLHKTQKKSMYTNESSKGELTEIFSDEVFSQVMYEYQPYKLIIIHHLNTLDNREDQGILYTVQGIDIVQSCIDWKVSFPIFGQLPDSFPSQVYYDQIHQVVAFQIMQRLYQVSLAGQNHVRLSSEYYQAQFMQNRLKKNKNLKISQFDTVKNPRQFSSSKEAQKYYEMQLYQSRKQLCLYKQDTLLRKVMKDYYDNKIYTRQFLCGEKKKDRILSENTETKIKKLADAQKNLMRSSIIGGDDENDDQEDKVNYLEIVTNQYKTNKEGYYINVNDPVYQDLKFKEFDFLDHGQKYKYQKKLQMKNEKKEFFLSKRTMKVQRMTTAKNDLFDKNNINKMIRQLNLPSLQFSRDQVNTDCTRSFMVMVDRSGDSIVSKNYTIIKDTPKQLDPSQTSLCSQKRKYIDLKMNRFMRDSLIFELITCKSKSKQKQMIMNLFEFSREFIFQPMYKIKGRNLVHLFADQADILEVIFTEYDPKIDSDPIILDFYGISPLDIALEQGAVSSVDMIIEIITCYQNKPYYSNLFEGRIHKIMALNVGIGEILGSRCAHTVIKNSQINPYVMDDTSIFRGIIPMNWDSIPYNNNYKEIFSNESQLSKDFNQEDLDDKLINGFTNIMTKEEPKVNMVQVQYYSTLIPELISHNFIEMIDNDEHEALLTKPVIKEIIEFKWQFTKRRLYRHFKIYCFMIILLFLLCVNIQYEVDDDDLTDDPTNQTYFVVTQTTEDPSTSDTLSRLLQENLDALDPNQTTSTDETLQDSEDLSLSGDNQDLTDPLDSELTSDVSTVGNSEQTTTTNTQAGDTTEEDQAEGSTDQSAGDTSTDTNSTQEVSSDETEDDSADSSMSLDSLTQQVYTIQQYSSNDRRGMRFTVLRGIISIYMVFVTISELKEYTKQSWRQTLFSIWNWVDILTITFWVLAMIYDINEIMSPSTQILYSIVIFLFLLKFFFFVRIFKELGFIIKMITRGFQDLGPFLVIFLSIIMTYTILFTLFDIQIYGDDAMNEDYQTLPQFPAVFISVFRHSIGDFDFSGVPELEGYKTGFFWVYWLILVFLMTIMFTNFLIAVISKSFDDINDLNDRTFDRQRLQLIREYEILSEASKKNPMFPKFVLSRQPFQLNYEQEGAENWAEKGYAATVNQGVAIQKGFNKLDTSFKDIKSIKIMMSNMQQNLSEFLDKQE